MLFKILHDFSLLIAIITLIIFVKLLFEKKWNFAFRWGIITILTLCFFFLYFVPFHIHLDSENVILISFESGPHYVIDAQLDPSEFQKIDNKLSSLDFKRPFVSDSRIYDAFQNDTVTITNHNMHIYIIFPSDTKTGYVVLNQDAVANITDDLIQYFSS